MAEYELLKPPEEKVKKEKKRKVPERLPKVRYDAYLQHIVDKRGREYVRVSPYTYDYPTPKQKLHRIKFRYYVKLGTLFGMKPHEAIKYFFSLEKKGRK